MPAPGRGNDAARRFAAGHGLDIGEPVDFWTEAALFSAAGLPVMVLGPGHIEQAHVTDEWVSMEQLDQAFAAYGRVVKSDA